MRANHRAVLRDLASFAWCSRMPTLDIDLSVDRVHDGQQGKSEDDMQLAVACTHFEETNEGGGQSLEGPLCYWVAIAPEGGRNTHQTAYVVPVEMFKLELERN